ncbi:hypothetical protein [Stenotrophomonas sp. 24(2023)]|uniref:hypothetical protein n=1 Tax=Stenotrophomonas sp. 24(2023) TaxID=3068324 RepID=UPI0027E11B3E|nr:hypothetical protein [Stenotrophomonas sp. 24(2023)]WMJ69538.1 hypothetical protein Q9R17_00040 [Stenotrophomonas sp. 24(2023)]
MYPLLLQRVEDGGPDFVLDIDGEVLIAAPDITSVSAGKGIAVILLLSLFLIDAAILRLIMKVVADGRIMSALVVGMLLVLLLSVAVGINVFNAIRKGNRLESLMLNRREGTFTQFSQAGAKTCDWRILKPFIRIIQIVHSAGGAVTYQLVLADVDEGTGVIRSEFIAAKGDLIGAGVQRYGFFRKFMEGAHDELPRFQIISQRMDWSKQLAVSLWTGNVLRQRWMGDKPWTPWLMVCSTIWVVLITPLQITELIGAWISKGPFGLKETGPWPGRFEKEKSSSPIKQKGRRYSEVTLLGKRLLLASMGLGVALWGMLLGMLLMVAFR